MSPWEVFAVKYAERNTRTRHDSFMFDENPTAQHSMDYFMWVLRRGDELLLVDTGYDREEANQRGRPIQMSPAEALAPLGITPADVSTIIVTHLHYDHAGGLHLFPDATLHLQAVEMAYATGPCMNYSALKAPFTADHICEVVQRLYAGRVVFHDGDGEVREGVTVHLVGGHSKGLQVLRVWTEAGWMCLALDASHYYENFQGGKSFPIVIDLKEMFDGFETIKRLASSPDLIIPGHDPLLFDLFPTYGADHIIRLDQGPIKDAGS